MSKIHGNIGKKRTKEQLLAKSIMAKKQGFGQWGLGKKRPPMSQEWKDKIGNAQKGKVLSEEVKKHHSEGAKKAGAGKWMKGRKLSEETRHKMSINRTAEKHPMWKGGAGEYKRAHAPRPRPEECEVCGAWVGSSGKTGIHYDHDHKTGKFRGWLCGRCNVALGMVKDNSETLIALAKYLRESKN